MSAVRRTVVIPTRRGEVRVTYRPAWITVADYADAETDPHGTAARLILSCVARWSLAEANGERYPLNAAGLALLSDTLVLDIAKAIIVDYRVVAVAEAERMTAA
jgi:hypothetical protein